MKSAKFPKLFSLGLESITIEFGDQISDETNQIAINFARFIEANSFPGFVEVVPAYASVTVFYDFYKVSRRLGENERAHQIIENTLRNYLKSFRKNSQNKERIIEIPVSFEKEYSPDLDFVAKTNNLSTAEVIKIFTSQNYRVFMLGFLPGFAYMGKLDSRIATPRKEKPRLRVPKGSIGIAGEQTGIYPFESPGGWQIIGRTNLEMFDLSKSSPCFLQVGDVVKFYEYSF